MTNFERIKSMTFDELLDFLFHNGGCGICSRDGVEEGCIYIDGCKPYIKEWLESEVKTKKEGE